MASLKEKVFNFSTLEDQNDQDRVAILCLENDNENWRKNVADRKAVKEMLSEQVENKKTDLEAAKKFFEALSSSLSQDVDKFRKRDEIIKLYVDTIKKEGDLLKLKQDVYDNNNDYVAKITPTALKGKELKKEIGNLEQLQKECDEMRRKTEAGGA